MPHKTRVLFSSIAVAAVISLAGCSTGDDATSAQEPAGSSTAGPAPSDAPSAPEGVTVIVPGGPGEEASTGVPEPVAPPEPNDADVTFLAMMVPHHAQAVAMADLAEQYATAPAVQALADRIRGSQAPEIVLMSAMLEELGEEPSEHGDHGDHGGHSDGAEGDEEVPTSDTPGIPEMPGMLTQAQLDELAQARGRAFDRLFLQRMIAHHEGALTMAGEVAVDGADIRVGELAADMTLGQAAEISRMQELLRA